MTGHALTVLVTGGYGTFGGRLVDLLADEPRLRIIVAGRSLEAATAFCRREARATLVPAAFDRMGTVSAELARWKPDIVVDASGPFQTYAGDPYALARAALSGGAHYIDLADGAEFVLGISALDVLAKEKGRFALSGASSFPVLTAAVVRRLADGLAHVDTITAGIAPSPHARVGLNVVRAIASYAGKPVAITQNGRKVPRHGFVDSRHLLVNVPGHVPLPVIRFGLVEVPDLEILSRDWPEARAIWMGAGPTPAILHRLLWLCAWAVRLRLLPSLTRFAKLMNWAINTVRWGEHRGGMIVEVTGREASGAEVARSWHLLAEGEDGPLIPSMAAEGLIRKCLDGDAPAPGARPAHRDLELDDYSRLFARRMIFTGFRSSADQAAGLYQTTLGEAFDRLPPVIASLHAEVPRSRWEGRATVTRGTNPLAKAIAFVMRMPTPQTDAPISVDFSRDASGVETWHRRFSGRSFRSKQRFGSGRWRGLVVESFGGPFAFAMALKVADGRLHLVPRYWSAFGLSMPRWLGPRAKAFEHADDGRFNFEVEINLPLVGRLVRYHGWLEPARAD